MILKESVIIAYNRNVIVKQISSRKKLEYYTYTPQFLLDRLHSQCSFSALPRCTEYLLLRCKSNTEGL